MLVCYFLGNGKVHFIINRKEKVEKYRLMRVESILALEKVEILRKIGHINSYYEVYFSVT